MDKPLKIISEIKTPRLTARAATTAMTDGLFHAIDISRNRLREFLFWVDNVQSSAPSTFTTFRTAIILPNLAIG